MIGNGRQLIVLGYTFASITDQQLKDTIEPFDKALKPASAPSSSAPAPARATAAPKATAAAASPAPAAAAKTLTTRIDELLQDIRRTIVALKKEEKAAKGQLEAQKDQRLGVLGTGDAEEPARRQYLWNTYVPRLREIGMSFEKVEAAIRKSPVYGKLMDDVQAAVRVKIGAAGEQRLFLEMKDGVLTLGWKGGWTPTRVSTLVELITGSDKAYVQVTGGAVTARPVFRKKTFDGYYDGGAVTEYVQDDDGIYTRRYGYAKKSKDVLRLLFAKGFLRGRYAKDQDPPRGDPLAGDPTIFRQRGRENLPDIGKTGTMTMRQMLHVHQELGSGDSQRGICLAVTSKDNIVSNQGIGFGGIPIEVDLAMVPTGKQLLYNLYRPEAQRKAESTKIRKTTGSGPRDYEDFDGSDHMLRSVSKNREVFLRVLLPDFLRDRAAVETALATT